MRRSKVGFTLVEMVVVIAVIAILTAVTVPTFVVVTNRARRSADLQQLYELNMMLFAGEIDKYDLGEYTLMTDGWEFAYSEQDNELAIVDETGKIVAARTASKVGTELQGDFKRLGELEFEPPEDDPQTSWWEKVEPLEQLPDTSSPEYGELRQREEIRLSVDAVPAEYFKDNTALKRIYADEKLLVVGNKAFRGCTALETVQLAGVQTIEDYAFTNCTALKELTLPSTLTSIGVYSFQSCNFVSLSLPGVTVEAGNLPGLTATVEHLTIEGGTINARMGAWMNKVILNSANNINMVTLHNVSAEGSPDPFNGMKSKASESKVELDEVSYNNLLASNTNVFNDCNIVKLWES